MGPSELKDRASELVRGLLQFPAPSEPFILYRIRPGEERKEFRFRIALLRGYEEVEVEQAAQKFAKEAGESVGYDTIVGMARAQELAAKCLVAEEPYERPDGTSTFHRIFTSGQQIRENLLNAEVAQVLNAYDVIKAKYSCLQFSAPEQLDEWIRALGDEMIGASFLSRLDSTLWPALLLLFAQRLAATLPSTPQAPSNSGSTSESDPQNSGGGTGTFTTLPEMRSSDGAVSFPTDKQLERSEAAELANRLY